MLNLPFFKSMSRRASLGKIKNMTAFSGRFRGLNFYISYLVLVIVYNFKALGLTKIHIYTKFYILFLILINIYLDILYLEVNIEKYTS
jgi:hypothetical protein